MTGRVRGWHRLGLLLALAGCGGGAECTLVGGVSQLTVRLPAGVAAAKACVADVCSETVVDGTVLVPLSRRADGDTAQVVVTLPGRPAPLTGVVDLQRTRPNGEDCLPVLVNGTAELDLAGGRVVTAAA